METGFDKEIDVLLRTASAGGNVGEGAEVMPHLEVDAIASYAENVLPPLIRKKYSEHIADCTRCRNVLANLIAMNAASPAEAAVPVRGGIESPRARRFFFVPAPVFALSALLVIFGGFLLYSALQVPLSGPAEISSFSEPEFPMPAANDKEALVSNAAPKESSEASSANVAAPKTPSDEKTAEMNAASPPLPLPKVQNKQEFAENALGPPPTVSTTETAGGIADLKSAEQSKREWEAFPEKERENVPAKKQKDDQVANADESKVSGGKAPEELTILAAPAAVPRTDDAANDRAARMQKKSSDETVVLDETKTTETRTRTIGGKTFENRGGVWFDSEYKGQDAAEIGRGTDAFRRLDAGLRSIADKLKGTVVVVWKKKAYRIN